jgi:hypothetical protein
MTVLNNSRRWRRMEVRGKRAKQKRLGVRMRKGA